MNRRVAGAVGAGIVIVLGLSVVALLTGPPERPGAPTATPTVEEIPPFPSPSPTEEATPSPSPSPSPEASPAPSPAPSPAALPTGIALTGPAIEAAWGWLGLIPLVGGLASMRALRRAH